MVKNYFIQFEGQEFDVSDIEDQVIAAAKNYGVDKRSIKAYEVYFKIEEGQLHKYLALLDKNGIYYDLVIE